MAEIKLKVDDFEVIIDPSELELKAELKDDLPPVEDIAEPMGIYDVDLYAEFVGSMRVKAITEYDACQKAKEELHESRYELSTWLHTEAHLRGTELVDPKTEEPFDYNTYIFTEYGYGYFNMKSWQIALLSSKNQTTLKEFHDHAQCLECGKKILIGDLIYGLVCGCGNKDPSMFDFKFPSKLQELKPDMISDDLKEKLKKRLEDLKRT